MPSESTAVILGAGFSYAAGLPLTRDLFEALPSAKSKQATRNHRLVASAWQEWKSLNQNSNAEEWLAHLFSQRHEPSRLENQSDGFFSDQVVAEPSMWEMALQFLAARLFPLPPGRNSLYYNGITRSVSSPVHRDFWRMMLTEFPVRYVVSMNYDLLAEQGLRREYGDSRSAPICFYGGFPRPQHVRKMTDVTHQRFELVELGHEVMLLKMHGSLNWALEPCDGFSVPQWKIHDDPRAAFRVKRDLGEVAIVPPVREKLRPLWLHNVWTAAAEALAHSDIWVVCGYSMPSYDRALLNFFATAAKRAVLHKLYILSPDSDSLVDKWKSICAPGTPIVPLPGLPDAVSEAWS